MLKIAVILLLVAAAVHCRKPVRKIITKTYYTKTYVIKKPIVVTKVYTSTLVVKGKGGKVLTFGGNANGAACAFPFKYRGKVYTKCMTEKHYTTPWCATTHDYGKNKKWGNCISGALRCKGIDNGCCTKAKPCGLGDGDCDFDDHCQKGLVCGVDNCAWGGNGDDCCMAKPRRCNGIDNGCCTKAKPCGIHDGDCDNDKECQEGLVCGLNNCAWGGNGDDCCVAPALRCKGIDNGCCTKAKPCGLGDGDCDNDKECKGNLVCGKDNCPWGDYDDCCTHKSNDEPSSENSTSEMFEEDEA